MTTQERKEQKNKVKASEGLIKFGYNSILERVKDIRQKFSTAFANGTRSGSGRIVLGRTFDFSKTMYAGPDFATESNLPGNDESFDDNFETTQHIRFCQY